MKTKFLKTFMASMVAITLVLGCITTTKAGATENQKSYKNVGYVFQRNCDIDTLDVTKITHLNYSFGLIYNEEYKDPAMGPETNPDVVVPKDFDPSLLNTIYLPDKVKSDLSRLDELKARNPDLKVMLSVGGWEARGFSDAAASDEGRKAFAKSCKEMIDTYGLAGVDLDWEYPVNGGWGVIKSRPEDKENFTLLLQEVRNAIGSDSLLSIAGSGNVNFSTNWTEFKKVIDILDYINIMTYDFRYGSCYFDSALYASKDWKTEFDYDDYNTDMAVKKYIEEGCPSEKINIGLAFAAGIPQIVSSKFDGEYKFIYDKLVSVGFYDQNIPQLQAVKNLKESDGFFKRWDNDAKAMYVIYKDTDGKEYFVMSYIEPKGLSEKTQYVKDNNLGGTMFWEFSADYDNSLVAQIASELNITKPVINPETPTPEVNEPKEEIKSDAITKTGDTVILPTLGLLALAGCVLFISKKK
ncbi:glycoside hydrolase family 18 protein [Clostridium paraputrificum]|uniref:glycoside hydrolase family 18 protein n=1 Tax=Clostridium TaxID=1485 RepID=UPI003D33FCCA